MVKGIGIKIKSNIGQKKPTIENGRFKRKYFI